MTGAVIEITRSRNPFDHWGSTRDANGVTHYAGLPATLPTMLRAHVAARPETEAVTQIGGDRLTYALLWERASRVAGGLRALGAEHGNRVALRYPAATNWVLAFRGTVLARTAIVTDASRGVGLAATQAISAAGGNAHA
ncbi:AMP-binding protein [Nocardia xishanensis]